MTVETVIDKSLSSVLAEVTEAMVDATKEYGPEAIDLALLVYRMEAAGSLLLALVCMVAIIVASTKYFQSCRKHWEDVDNDPAIIILAGLGVIGGPTFLMVGGHSIVNLLNVYYWAALFGYPEVMVAYKALVAAGML